MGKIVNVVCEALLLPAGIGFTFTFARCPPMSPHRASIICLYFIPGQLEKYILIISG